MVTIERGVPVPQMRTGRPAKYPWDKMGVGDSFSVSGKTLNGIRSTARYHANRLGREFRVATDGSGVRVWRTA